MKFNCPHCGNRLTLTDEDVLRCDTPSCFSDSCSTGEEVPEGFHVEDAYKALCNAHEKEETELANYNPRLP